MQLAAQTPVEPDSVVAAALHHSDDVADPGIRRLRHGKHFRYADADGHPVRQPATLSRIRALAIPPAWTDVWIAADPVGHIQATGRDARKRKQYRYHVEWRRVRDEAKYGRLVAFCHALPKLRAAVDRDLSCPCLCKRKVVATIVALLERAQLRIGNDEYTRHNGSYGATTLRDRHAKISGNTLELSYRGKSGIDRRVRVTDRRLARIVRSCRDLPGQRLFQYIDGDAIRPITSTDVNAYVREVSDGPFTAKDYRTWAATLGAAMLFCMIERPRTAREHKRSLCRVIEAVAERLGHKPAVCRASYIHPRVIEDFESDRLARRLAGPIRRRLGHTVAVGPDAIRVELLRAIEPIVARYLEVGTRRARAIA
jgi:DNA topoisomerase-1